MSNKTQRWGYPMNPASVLFPELNYALLTIDDERGARWQSSGGREAAFANASPTPPPPRKAWDKLTSRERAMTRGSRRAQ